METFVIEICNVPEGGHNAENEAQENKTADICRLCLNLAILQSIADIKFVKYHNKLTFLETELNFQLPEEVCENCWHKLDDILSFVKKCKDSHCIYDQMLKNCNIIKEENTIIENNNEIDGDIDADSCESQLEIKEESKDDTDNVEEEIKTEPGELENITVTIKNMKKITYTKYNKKHESEICPTCGDKSTSTLAAHYKVSPKCYPKNYKCTVCNSSYANKFKLNLHQQTKHGNLTVMCHICSKIMRNPGSLRRHLRQHDNGKIHMCEVCGRSFARPDNLTKHRELHNQTRPNQRRVKTINNRSKKPQVFSCKYCPKIFSFAHRFLAHLKTHREKDANDKVEVKPGDLTCPVCKREFSHIRPLKTHIVSHEQKRVYTCVKCQDFFYDGLSYKKHLLTNHDDDRTFVCTICSKKFLTQSNLNAHMLSHQDPQISCTLCDRKFRLRGHLTRHLAVVHDVNRGEPYHCKFCGRMFFSKGNCTIHERIHTGEKPYSCHICNKSFIASNTRKCHVRRVHGQEEVEKIKKFQP